jgi:hypothetical protein
MPGFDTNQHRIHRTHLIRAIRRLGWLDHKIAQDAVHLQSIGLDSAQVVAAGDEGNLLASLRQPPAEVASHTARAEDRDSHTFLLEAGRYFDYKLIPEFNRLIRDRYPAPFPSPNKANNRI